MFQYCHVLVKFSEYLLDDKFPKETDEDFISALNNIKAFFIIIGDENRIQALEMKILSTI